MALLTCWVVGGVEVGGQRGVDIDGGKGSSELNVTESHLLIDSGERADMIMTYNSGKVRQVVLAILSLDRQVQTRHTAANVGHDTSDTISSRCASMHYAISYDEDRIKTCLRDPSS